MLAWFVDNSLLALLGLGTAFSVFWLIRYRGIIKIPWWTALTLGVLHTVVGVLSVKIFAVMETLDISKAGNMSLFGGVFFMPLLYLLGVKVFKRRTAVVCDVFTPCMVFTVMCARINCLLTDCCLGQYIPGTTTGLRYPTREAEIIFYVALLFYFLIREKRQNSSAGRYYPIYMMSYGLLRFVLEFFRSSDSNSLVHISHLWALLSFVIGMAIYMEQKSGESKKNYRENGVYHRSKKRRK